MGLRRSTYSKKNYTTEEAFY